MKRIASLAIVAVIAVGCAGTPPPLSFGPTPTPVVVYVTPVPTVAPTPTPSPTPSPTPNPTPSPTPMLTGMTAECSAVVRPFIGRLQGLYDFVQVSRTKDAYKAIVLSIKGAPYTTFNDTMAALAGSLGYTECLVFGVKAEDTMNLFIDAYNDWADTTKLQDDWAKATVMLEELQAALPDGFIAGIQPPVIQPIKVVVKGSGSRNTKPFTLRAGNYTVTMVGRAGSYSNISAVLHTTGGAYIDLLFNELRDAGSYKYSTEEYGITGGKYYMEVTGGGSWSITFTPQR